MQLAAKKVRHFYISYQRTRYTEIEVYQTPKGYVLIKQVKNKDTGYTTRTELDQKPEDWEGVKKVVEYYAAKITNAKAMWSIVKEYANAMNIGKGEGRTLKLYRAAKAWKAEQTKHQEAKEKEIREFYKKVRYATD